MRAPMSVLMTGASSGIGAALAVAYAREGIMLALGGRDMARLEAVAARCRALGARVSAVRVDVTDPAATAAWVAAADADLVIANAGISAGTGGEGESDAQVRRIFAVNVDGVFNTIHPAIAVMRKRPLGAEGTRGQIAIMSSLAGFRGFAGAPAYCASKAAVKVYGEALRPDLAAEGIGLSVICPGYVRSPMTAENDFPMPFLMDAGRAAEIIRRGLARNAARIAFPWPMYWAAWLCGALPPSWLDATMRRLPRKTGAI
jgi:NAD(P)-dependent dehydrogenase (short-subunit alcohol dehydrogenase family)